MKFKCTKIKYDLENLTSEAKLPSSATITVNDDMVDCCVDEDGNRDNEELAEMVWDALEEKLGQEVSDFSWDIKK